VTKNETIKAGVIGWPVGHSLSPRLHGFWLQAYSINGIYEPIAVKPEDFRDQFRGLADAGYAGVNVTVPHKEAALANVDEADDNALRIGAVNTVVVRDDGSLHGSNTDGFGFIENLKDGAPGFDFTNGPAVILGAGGAARAVVTALIDAGVPDIRLTNRTMSRAETLADQIAGPVTVVPWEKRDATLNDAQLLVNTTTLGMNNQPPLEIDITGLPDNAVINDIVYAPLETDLIKTARARGLTPVDGIGMLLHQARPGFAQWFGVQPDVSQALRDHVLAGVKG
jgi:shikimate dehydrogenase